MVVGRNDTLNEVADNELVLLRKLDHPNIVKFYGEAYLNLLLQSHSGSGAHQNGISKW